MAHKMKYTNGKKADVSAFPFKTQENVIDNTIELLEKENDLSKEIQQTKKEMSTNNENI